MKFNTSLDKIPIEYIKDNDIKKINRLPLLEKAADLLKNGKIVGFPTETVYGLGADARKSSAVKKIFQAKGRPQDNPLIVHIGDMNQLKTVIRGEMEDDIRQILEEFWPGPLTIVFPKSELIPERTTAGLDTVGVRMPAHPVALALIQKIGFPLAAPSANTSGLPSPTRAEHVLDDLSGKIPLILDGGSCQVGVESTVITFEDEKIIILRPGGITREQLKKITDRKVVSSFGQDKISILKENNNQSSGKIPLAPGMKYRHYTPETDLVLFAGRLDRLSELYSSYADKNIFLVLSDETIAEIKKNNIFSAKGEIIEMGDLDFFLSEKNSDQIRKKVINEKIIKMVNIGSKDRLDEIANRIFYILRELDRPAIDLIIVEIFSEIGIGEAVMNRLYKASSAVIR